MQTRSLTDEKFVAAAPHGVTATEFSINFLRVNDPHGLSPLINKTNYSRHKDGFEIILFLRTLYRGAEEN